MDYLKYLDMDSMLHKLDPRTKFVYFIVMAVVTSVIKSGVALLFLFAFFLAIWIYCGITKYIGMLAMKLKVLLCFIFLLWLVIGLFSEPETGKQFIFFEREFQLFGKPVYFCFDWYDLYKGAVYALRIFLMVSSFYTVLLTSNFSEMILGLQKWKIPYSIAFGIGLVFQIIPLIIDELRAIMEAQSSRGLEIDECNWITKTKNYITFSLPLLFRVISKGQAISLAMHYYRLDFSVKRTAYKSIHTSKYDVYFALANIAAVAMTIFLRFCFYIPV